MKQLIPVTLLILNVGCSFQKDPERNSQIKVEKIGMTREELERELIFDESKAFPDRLMYAIRKKDPALAFKIIDEADNLDEYGSAGSSALGLAFIYGQDEIAAHLLMKGASPFKPHRYGGIRPVDVYEARSFRSENLERLINVADKKFFEEGLFHIKDAPTVGLAFRAYFGAGYPLTRVRDGRTLLGQILKSFKSKPRKINRFCMHEIKSLFKYAQTTEKFYRNHWLKIAEIASSQASTDLLTFSLHQIAPLKLEEINFIISDAFAYSLNQGIETAYLLKGYSENADIDSMVKTVLTQKSDEDLLKDFDGYYLRKFLREKSQERYRNLRQFWKEQDEDGAAELPGPSYNRSLLEEVHRGEVPVTSCS